MLDKEKFVKYLEAHAQPHSTGYCARHVRMALEAGGLDTAGHPEDAKNYGVFLRKLGAAETPNQGYDPAKAEHADIVVYEGNDTHIHGHVQAYDGSIWISDFKQLHFSPFRSDTPPHAIYRFV